MPFLGILLALAQEWDIIAPAAGLLFLRLALQLIEVFIAQDNLMVSQ